MLKNFKRDIVVSLAIIGGTLIVFTVAFYFISRDLTTEADAILADRAAIMDKTKTIDSLVTLKRDAGQADQYKQAMDQILVTQDQLIDFPRWLDGLARGRQVTMDFSFAPDVTPATTDAPGHMSFTINVGGRPDNLIAFVKDLEFRSPKFLINIENADWRGGGSEYIVSLTGKVFFR